MTLSLSSGYSYSATGYSSFAVGYIDEYDKGGVAPRIIHLIFQKYHGSIDGRIFLSCQSKD